MDPASIYLQQQKVPELIDKLVLLLVEDQPSNAKQFLKEKLNEMIESRFESTDAAKALERMLPPLNPRATVRPVLVAKPLTNELYRTLSRLRTGMGVSLDDCLRSGIAYHLSGTQANTTTIPYGLMLGDADCFTTFGDAIDGALGARIGGGGLTGAGGKAFLAPKSETGSGAITSGFQFPEKYVVGASVKLVRNIQTFRMTQCTTRAERREISHLLQRLCTTAFQGSSTTSGAIKSASAIASTLDPILINLRLPPSPVPESEPWHSQANVEWPDARCSFVSDDNVFFVNILSGSEHVEIGTRAVRSHDVRDAFERVMAGAQTLNESLVREDSRFEWQHLPKYGYLMSNLDRLYGGGITVTFALRLPLLIGHAQLPKVLSTLKLQRLPLASSNAALDILVVENKTDEKPYSLMEAGLVQLCCSSVNTMIALEEVLRQGGSIDGRY